jgi:hypothetical protein
LHIVEKKKSERGEKVMLEETKVKAASALRLPKDVVLGEVLVSFLGRHSVVIENYRSIILYTDCLIKIKAKILPGYHRWKPPDDRVLHQ